MENVSVMENPNLTLVDKIECREQEINRGIYEHRSFSTKSLILRGKVDVKVPGRETYQNVDEVFINYEQPMEVDLRGCIAETEGILEVCFGRLQVVAYRENKAETALDKRYGSIVVVEPKQQPDPEITMYTGDKRVVLNQVIGIPVINVRQAKLTYLI
ncbi:hypothetical protein HYT57_02225 [Candidatus Woesearchaeota archaeon]|nr:hypothetical protein [Candidatus Woesearchaeota archaeon]